ncbi:MAG TPA: Asp-tRNA(Asn)/Glu-tRNA(Gln) amidotransferase subunit GatC [Bacillaceae bacterium]
MSKISKEQVHHVAHLARLDINEEQAAALADDLAKIISMAEKLDEIDVASIEPTSHVFEQKNIMREDVAEKGLPREEVLKNAPDHQDGQIKVPSILE